MRHALLTLTAMALVWITGCKASDVPPPHGGGPAHANARSNMAAPSHTMEIPPQSDDYISFEGGVKVFPSLKRVEVDARVLGGQSRPLEFLIVGPGGSAHEALFTVTARAEHIKRGLEIVGLKEAKEHFSGRGYRETPQGDIVRISVRFTRSDNGKEAMVRVEDWLLNGITNASPAPGMFVFTGGQEQYLPELNRSVVSADQYGNLAAVWHDASCIIDNRHDHGSMSDVYEPNPNAPGRPQAGSAVVLVFEPER